MQLGFFDIDRRYAMLSEQGDPLERLSKVIDWEIFRGILEKIDAKPRKSNAGRKATDRVLMFKLLILQRIYSLADEKLQFQVTDRLSFMRFLGLEFGGSVPDARTVWAFREELKEHDLADALFNQFDSALQSMGVQMNSGQIIDATFIPVPIQRNSKEDNESIKQGQKPSDWSEKQAAHKDTDARWTKKNGVSHYGYKNHINADKKLKLITKWSSTDASVHDSQEFKTVLRSAHEGGAEISADSAYASEANEAHLKEHRYNSRIHERAYRNKPLSEQQKMDNKEKSKTRARVEHVFGHMQTSLGGMLIRSIGARRAKLNIGLMNLAYNISRVETLIRKKIIAIAGVGAPKMA
jgi:IS5 family transposase